MDWKCLRKNTGYLYAGKLEVQRRRENLKNSIFYTLCVMYLRRLNQEAGDGYDV
jgi:hypothetical protein